MPDCGHPGGQHTHQSPSAVSWVRIAHNNWGQFSYIRIALDGEYVCFHMIKKTKKSSNITTTFSSIFMTIYNIYYGPKFPNDRKKNSSNITTTFGSNSMTIYILRGDIMHKKWEQKNNFSNIKTTFGVNFLIMYICTMGRYFALWPCTVYFMRVS